MNCSGGSRGFSQSEMTCGQMGGRGGSGISQNVVPSQLALLRQPGMSAAKHSCVTAGFDHSCATHSPQRLETPSAGLVKARGEEVEGGEDAAVGAQAVLLHDLQYIKVGRHVWQNKSRQRPLCTCLLA